jgi:hypothetical protein
MSDMETIAVSKAIDSKLKINWNQARLVARSMTGEEIVFPWDEDVPEDSKVPYTPEEMLRAQEDYENAINKPTN